MNSKTCTVTLMFLLCVTNIIASQKLMDIGAPNIKNYDPSKNFGTKYIWSIAQDQRGVMFFSDRKGVIEFDGSNWRVHRLPSESPIRSMAIDDDHRIYVGGINDFGYFEPDKTGSLKYKSLNYKLPNDIPYYQSVWKTFVTSEGVYFISKKYVFRYFNDSIEVIPVDLHFPYGYALNDVIYVIDKQWGISSLDSNSLNPISGCERIDFKNHEFIYIDAINKDELLIVLSKKAKFYKYNFNNKKLNEFKLSPTLKNFLEKNHIYSILHISDGKTALGTTSGGVGIIDDHGELIQVINKNRGLSSDFVNNLFLDLEKNLWVTTQKGISRIDINTPLRFFGENQGVTNDVTYSSFHAGNQYLVTGKGSYLYYFPDYKISSNNDNIVLKKINGNHESRHICDVNGHLVLSNWYGLAELVNNKTVPLLKGKRVFCTAYTSKFPNTLFIGKNRALVIARFKETSAKEPLQITDTIRITENISQIRHMAFDKYNNLWFTSFNEGVYVVCFNKDNLAEYTLTKFSEKNGLPKYLQDAFVTNFNDQINIFTSKGIYKPITENEMTPDSSATFEHDLYWGKDIAKDSAQIKIAKQIDKNKFFIYGEKTGILHITEDSTFLNSKPFRKLNEIHSVSVRDHRYINFGANESFCIYDSYADRDYDKSFNAYIREVSIALNDSLLFGGSYPVAKGNKKPDKQLSGFVPTIENKFNSLMFRFCASFLEASDKTRFRYKLEGFDKTWSPWSTETSALYSSIPYGAYTFKVMAENIYGTKSSIASYSFKVKPAWYQTTYAYIVYFVLGILFIAFVTWAYNKQLARQNNKLEKLVKIRTGELHDAINILEKQKIELKNKQSEILLQNSTLSEQGEKLKNTITQLKETQSSLVQQEKMASLGILTAGVAHEINNPLNYILGGYTGLEMYFHEKDEESEDIQVLMESIKTGVDRAADIVSGLNQFSRTKNTFDENCEIHSILDNSSLMIKHLLKNNIKLTKNYGAVPCTVTGNVGKLHQVFINILTNSCQAIENNGEISIDTCVEKKNMIVKVSDSGEGISKENIDKITDPFFTTKAPGKGSGLGLSITYKIIQEHRGKLEYKSIYGEGTTAIITLPINQTFNGQN